MPLAATSAPIAIAIPPKPTYNEEVVGRNLPTRAVEARKYARTALETLAQVDPNSSVLSGIVSGTANGEKLYTAWSQAGTAASYLGKGLRGDVYGAPNGHEDPAPEGQAEFHTGLRQLADVRTTMFRLTETSTPPGQAVISKIATDLRAAYDTIDSVAKTYVPRT